MCEDPKAKLHSSSWIVVDDRDWKCLDDRSAVVDRTEVVRILERFHQERVHED